MGDFTPEFEAQTGRAVGAANRMSFSKPNSLESLDRGRPLLDVSRNFFSPEHGPPGRRRRVRFGYAVCQMDVRFKSRIHLALMGLFLASVVMFYFDRRILIGTPTIRPPVITWIGFSNQRDGTLLATLKISNPNEDGISFRLFRHDGSGFDSSPYYYRRARRLGPKRAMQCEVLATGVVGGWKVIAGYERVGTPREKLMRWLYMFEVDHHLPIFPSPSPSLVAEQATVVEFQMPDVPDAKNRITP